MKVFNIKCIFASLVDPGIGQSVQYTGCGLVRSRQSQATLVLNDPVGSGTHPPTYSAGISFSFSEIKTARSWSWLRSCICCRGDSSVNLHVTWCCEQAQVIATPALLCCTPFGYVLVAKQSEWVVVDVFKLRIREEVGVSRLHCDVAADCLRVGCDAVSLGCRFLTFRTFKERFFFFSSSSSSSFSCCCCCSNCSSCCCCSCSSPPHPPPQHSS